MTASLAFVALSAAWAGPPTGNLPDIAAEAVRGRCERPPIETTAKTSPGADQTYVGQFTVAPDGTVTGYERRLLFANADWKASTSEDGHHGQDCINQWTVVGEVAEPSACSTCGLAIHFQADIDYEASTCPQRLVVDGNHFRSAYDIKKNSDGTIEVFFSNSGNKVGRGYWRGSSFNYITNHRCVWL